MREEEETKNFEIILFRWECARVAHTDDYSKRNLSLLYRI